ncbi:MAG TPA: sigma-70 region 4 domain-containing protein [Terracidiphilus sp.]|jgi:predicted DNA-binding protein (UPF0251 family)
MSAALQLPVVWGAASAEAVWVEGKRTRENQPAAKPASQPARSSPPDTSLAFYRKHTESMLRRYLYASMLMGRAPALLGDAVGRGWVSSRRIRSFEDAVIFVLDVETCLNKLNVLDRKMLSRIVLQEYTQAEAADMLGMSVRTVVYKFPQALDRLTRLLLDAKLLVIPY